MAKYKVRVPFYYCCWNCRHISEFEKGEIISDAGTVTGGPGGGWRYLCCPSCGMARKGINCDPAYPRLVVSFPYSFLEKIQ